MKTLNFSLGVKLAWEKNLVIFGIDVLCCSEKKKNLVIFCGDRLVLSLHWEKNLVIFFRGSYM